MVWPVSGGSEFARTFIGPPTSRGLFTSPGSRLGSGAAGCSGRWRCTNVVCRSARRIAGDLADLFVERLQAGVHPAIDPLVQVVVQLVANPIRIDGLREAGHLRDGAAERAVDPEPD